MDTMPQQRIEELKLPVVEFVNSCEAEALNLDANITLHTLKHVANMKHQSVLPVLIEQIEHFYFKTSIKE